ncbi:MAG: AI-2E family transporter [Clostridia bacterium]|nr:AI-2E family transporter [Clostridia bacterium]
MRKELRPEMNKKYNTIAVYTLCVTLIIACFIFAIVYSIPIGIFLTRLVNILSPVLYGFVFAYVLCPVCNFFDKCLKKLSGDKKIHRYFLNPISRRGGIVITYILFVSVLVGSIYIVIPQISDSFNSFYDNYKIYIARADIFFKDLSENFKFIPADVVQSIEQSIVSLLERFVESSFQLVTQYSPVLINKVSGFAVGVWNIVLGIIISIYVLAERKNFMRAGKKIVYSMFSVKKATAVCEGIKKTHEVFGGFVNGKLLDSLIIGIICFAGTSILRIPYAPLVSLIVGITNVIPYFGPFMGAIPSVILVFLNDPVKSLWLAVFILVLQQLDGNYIGPKILGQTIGVSSFWIITSLLVMGGLYGVVGMVLAVPLFALLQMLVSKICNGVLMRKGISVTNDGVNIMEVEDPLEFEDAEAFDGEYAIQDDKGEEIK